MRLADMVAGKPHEARENDGWLYGATAVEHGGEAANQHWYHNVAGDIRHLFEAGANESSTSQRRTHPGYSKLETRSFDDPDWREQAIVSPFSDIVLIQPAAPSVAFPLHAGLSVRSQHHCVASILIVHRHSFELFKSLLIVLTLSLLLLPIVASQPST